VLVKEYVDDGVPGPLLDRPALNRLREDAKGNVYDVVYFLDADRIARLVAYLPLADCIETITYDNGKEFARRTYIPKADGSRRPLGIPSFEDKQQRHERNRPMTIKHLMIAAILVPSVAHAGIWHYSCQVNGKTYPLNVDEGKKVLNWQGKKYSITVGTVNGEDCAKYCWAARGNGAAFTVGTATHGVAYFTDKNGNDVECDQTGKQFPDR
jgi:hypothetical protein